MILVKMTPNSTFTDIITDTLLAAAVATATSAVDHSSLLIHLIVCVCVCVRYLQWRAGIGKGEQKIHFGEFLTI